MRIPWSTPTVSDATKLGLAKVTPPALTGERLYELLFQLSLSDDFADLDDWTKVDSGGNVNLAAGVVSINGNGAWQANGIFRTAGIARAAGYQEFKLQSIAPAAALSVALGAHLAASLAANSSLGVWSISTQTRVADLSECGMSALSGTLAAAQATPKGTTDTWYTVRQYLLLNHAGTLARVLITIQGGTEWPNETTIINASRVAVAPATIYPEFQRYTNDANALTKIKEWRWYSGYPTDGPTLTFIADAGAGKTFSGLVFANLAAVGAWATTNVTFAYDFSDSATPSFSAEKTLAQLNALDALTTSKRYIHLRVTVNSDGATQQYAGEINADDGTAMPAASEPESSASEASYSETSASEVSYSASSASELSVSSESPLSGSSASEVSYSDSSASGGGGDSNSSGSYSSYSDSSATSGSTSESSNSVSASSNSSSESGLGVAANDWEMQIRGEGDTVTVQRRTLTKTATGAQQCTWTSDGASLYAMVQDASSNDRTAYAERQIRVTHSVFVAVDPVVVEGTRLLWGSKTLIVHGVRDMLNRGELWQLDCEEVK